MEYVTTYCCCPWVTTRFICANPFIKYGNGYILTIEYETNCTQIADFMFRSLF